MKSIVLMRHGEASWDAPSDSQRPLTPRGQKQARETAEILLQQDFRPDLLIHSPYRRTCETTEGVLESFPACKTTEESGITPSGNPEKIADMLNTLSAQHILLVTHNPFVTDLMHYLVYGTFQPSQRSSLPVFGTACAAWLTADEIIPGTFSVHSFLQPLS